MSLELVKTTRYDGTPTTEVRLDGVVLGSVYKGEDRAPVYGRTNYAIGYSVRKGWKVFDKSSQTTSFSRTKQAGIEELVRYHQLRQRALKGTRS